jgi:flagellar basal-body rod modification protein FlgD
MTGSVMTALNPFTYGNPTANETKTGTSADAAPSTISANDFLTLLVTEMKNQDPTAQTDPNQYVNQLVQVNSLEQLIEINENLAAMGNSNSGMAHAASRVPTSVAQRMDTMGSLSDLSAVAGETGTLGAGNPIANPIAVSANPIRATTGNLGIPGANPAAKRVAQALSGH